MDSESTHENSSIKNVEECDPRCSFRGPENSSWRHNPDELKRIHINIVRKQSSSVSSTSLDPQLIAPVRRPDEGKVPLFSKIPVHSVDSGGQDEEKASRGAKNRERETSPAKKERRILSGRSCSAKRLRRFLRPVAIIDSASFCNFALTIQRMPTFFEATLLSFP
ncbi:Hypothetical protein NTJ_00972 [Nesidiocoris tenuis]|uniref:Uncharacterized protein n=1 Tax=Nesidiocoris tenuis TaxID=355587 RepID=A0ABN7A7D6_9HEMI|nr:Hypothetical protein NTJ_00972 [Nesidiocoris tenuis]